ncbi:MAG TPA: EF-P lysine aminoacylase EpmA [Kofleriaceae bacterium]|nr:EF-P lysine aminoacylase EpmA [Kofleriaceae bacterium]
MNLEIRRGRVLAVDGERGIAIVRGERGDGRVPASTTWRPGDLVESTVAGDPRDGLQWSVVRAFTGGDYPAPATEVARLPRVRLAALQARATALAALRGFFAERDFLEVETPLLVPSPGLEIHLDAVTAGDGFLITSPEYQMKRLLAAGFERIYQVCKCFRAGERGPHHASEFTMVEWYRGFAELDAIIADTEGLVERVVTAVGGSPIACVIERDLERTMARSIDVTPPWPRITVREAMQRWAGITVHGDEPAPALVAAVRAAGIAVADGTAWDDAFFAAFLARVEPALAALDRPIIVEDWPAPLAALARKKPGDPAVALRFEAYVGGLELANAFGELTDPVEQRARFEHDQATRRARGRAVYPIDDKLIAALAEGLPPSAGIALGFDRLVMLATGAPTIDQVLTFTTDEL